MFRQALQHKIFGNRCERQILKGSHAAASKKEPLCTLRATARCGVLAQTVTGM